MTIGDDLCKGSKHHFAGHACTQTENDIFVKRAPAPAHTCWRTPRKSPVQTCQQNDKRARRRDLPPRVLVDVISLCVCMFVRLAQLGGVSMFMCFFVCVCVRARTFSTLSVTHLQEALPNCGGADVYPQHLCAFMCFYVCVCARM